jgi:hypothetical protein
LRIIRKLNKYMHMQENKTNSFGKQSLISIIFTVILASVTHAYQFGYRAFVAGGILIIILGMLNIFYQRNKNKMLIVLYALLNAWVIVGFGIINGFWNHAFKVFLTYLHNGYLPPLLAGLFLDPKIGSVFFEGTGILTFVASMFATYYIFKMI